MASQRPATNTTSRRPYNLILAAVFIALSATMTWLMRIEPVADEVPVGFQEQLEAAQFKDGTPLKTRYTGIAGVDVVLTILVMAFVSGTAGWVQGIRWQQMHFLGNLISIVCVWTVEAFRKRSMRGAVLSMMLVALSYQVMGSAILCPLYHAADLFYSVSDRSFASGSEVPLSLTKVLIPALVIGFIIPTIAMFYPWNDLTLTQNLTAFWQPSPVYPLIVAWPLSFFVSSVSSESSGTSTKYLKTAYLFCAIVSAITHLGIIYAGLTSEDPLSALSFMFIPNAATRKDTTALGLHYIFVWDWWGCFGAALLYSWVAAFDVVRLTDGAKKSLVLARITMLLVATAVVLGPGTAMAAVWWWREDKLSVIEQKLGTAQSKSKAS